MKPPFYDELHEIGAQIASVIGFYSDIYTKTEKRISQLKSEWGINKIDLKKLGLSYDEEELSELRDSEMSQNKFEILMCNALSKYNSLYSIRIAEYLEPHLQADGFIKRSFSKCLNDAEILDEWLHDALPPKFISDWQGDMDDFAFVLFNKLFCLNRNNAKLQSLNMLFEYQIIMGRYLFDTLRKLEPVLFEPFDILYSNPLVLEALASVGIGAMDFKEELVREFAKKEALSLQRVVIVPKNGADIALNCTMKYLLKSNYQNRHRLHQTLQEDHGIMTLLYTNPGLALQKLQQKIDPREYELNTLFVRMGL